MGAKKALGDAFFKHIASRRAPSLFKKMMRSLDSGQYQVPKSFDVMSRFPSEELKLHQAPPLRINLPENALLQRVHVAYPDTKQEAVALASMQPPVARQFVWRQLQLLQASNPGRTEFSAAERDRTFAVVEGEMASSLIKLRRRGKLAGSDQLALLQAEEELQLKAALDAVALKSNPR